MTVPSDERLRQLASIHETLAGFFDRMVEVDPESKGSAERNRDVAAACRAVIAMRAALEQAEFGRFAVCMDDLRAILGPTGGGDAP